MRVCRVQIALPDNVAWPLISLLGPASSLFRLYDWGSNTQLHPYRPSNDTEDTSYNVPVGKVKTAVSVTLCEDKINLT